MARELEQWGGEVRVPGWLRRLLRRPDPQESTPEAVAEARKAADDARKVHPTASVLKNADRAAMGSLGEIYQEGRKKKKPRQSAS